jgi:uncharacterized oligopeptide transporter (OPT) family protein
MPRARDITTTKMNTPRAADVACWIGRGLGTLAVVFVLVFWIGEGMRPWALDLPDGIAMAVLAVGLAGHLLAWRYQRVGATVAVTAWLLFALLNHARSGSLPSAVFVVLLLAPAVVTGISVALKARWRSASDGNVPPIGR